jgi:DNA integrity scanning protein DisA with diadenylate cyclase activity
MLTKLYAVFGYLNTTALADPSISPRGATVTADACQQTLQCLEEALRL